MLMYITGENKYKSRTGNEAFTEHRRELLQSLFHIA